MVIFAPAERPMKLSIRLADRVFVDTGEVAPVASAKGGSGGRLTVTLRGES